MYYICHVTYSLSCVTSLPFTTFLPGTFCLLYEYSEFELSTPFTYVFLPTSWLYQLYVVRKYVYLDAGSFPVHSCGIFCETSVEKLELATVTKQAKLSIRSTKCIDSELH